MHTYLHKEHPIRCLKLDLGLILSYTYSLNGPMLRLKLFHTQVEASTKFES